jgi:hypothetical protein
MSLLRSLGIISCVNCKDAVCRLRSTLLPGHAAEDRQRAPERTLSGAGGGMKGAGQTGNRSVIALFPPAGTNQDADHTGG